MHTVRAASRPPLSEASAPWAPRHAEAVAPPGRSRSTPEPLGEPVVPRSAALGLEARRALGPLLPLLDDPELRDLLIHLRGGVGELWLDRGSRACRVEGWRSGPAEVRRLAVALIAAGGRQLDELHPCAEVHLGAGIRVHAVLPPISVAGPVLSIRIPRRAPLGFERLVATGLCDPPIAAGLRAAVTGRRNLLITGATGSGKTTLLAALLDLAAPDERIITIEDIAELRLAHPHRVALEARPPNAEGGGEIPVDRLLREALRMRPDRIVLGECRGAEVATLLSALNTGHSGGAGTLHANSLADVPARLEALGMLAGYEPAVLARQAISALHLVVHVERSAQRGHRITALGRLGLRDGALIVEPA
ncbi:MAG: CpaF family protein [Leucobacter sp.]